MKRVCTADDHPRELPVTDMRFKGLCYADGGVALHYSDRNGARVTVSTESMVEFRFGLIGNVEYGGNTRVCVLSPRSLSDVLSRVAAIDPNDAHLHDHVSGVAASSSCLFVDVEAIFAWHPGLFLLCRSFVIETNDERAFSLAMRL